MRWPFGRKKKQEEPVQPDSVYVRLPQAQIIVSKQKPEPQGVKKLIKKQKPAESEDFTIKPFVYSSTEELESISRGTLFKEKARKDGGVQTDGAKKWDKERVRAMLIETDPEKLPTLTVTRKGEFVALVTATTFDQVARMGQHRDLRKDSFTRMQIYNRDIRAPSAFPEEGDSRKELMKQLEIMIAEEATSRNMMRFGGG